MKCSRIALLLVPMVLGLAAAAPAAKKDATGPLEKTAWLPLPHLDAMYPADSFKSATDGRDGDLATEDRDDDLEGVAGNEATDSGVPALRDSDYNGYYGNDVDQAESSSDSDQNATATFDMSTTPESSNDDADQSGAVDQANADAEPETVASMQSDDGGDADQSDAAQESTDMNGYDGDSEASEGDADTDTANPMNSNTEDNEDAGESDGVEKAESLESCAANGWRGGIVGRLLERVCVLLPSEQVRDNADSTAAYLPPCYGWRIGRRGQSRSCERRLIMFAGNLPRLIGTPC